MIRSRLPKNLPKNPDVVVYEETPRNLPENRYRCGYEDRYHEFEDSTGGYGFKSTLRNPSDRDFDPFCIMRPFSEAHRLQILFGELQSEFLLKELSQFFIITTANQNLEFGIPLQNPTEATMQEERQRRQEIQELENDRCLRTRFRPHRFDPDSDSDSDMFRYMCTICGVFTPRDAAFERSNIIVPLYLA